MRYVPLAGQKDSDDVIKFTSLFVKLKSLSDDDPNKLADLAHANAAVALIDGLVSEDFRTTSSPALRNACRFSGHRSMERL